MMRHLTEALIAAAALLLALSLLFFLFHRTTEEKKEPFTCVEVKDRVHVCTPGVEEQYGRTRTEEIQDQVSP